MTRIASVAVIGAGISGLVTAYRIRQASLSKGLPLRIQIFERSAPPGGVIQTERTKGYVLEYGPEGFPSFKKSVLMLIDELGLSNQLLPSNTKQSRTFVLCGETLRPLPEGLTFLAPVRFRPFLRNRVLSRIGKLRCLLEPLIPAGEGEPTVDRFFERRLGREFTEKIAEPLVSAIYGADIESLGACDTLPHLISWERRYGSLWRGARRESRTGTPQSVAPFYTLRSGMASLPERLCRALPTGTLVLHSGLDAITKTKNGYQLQCGCDIFEFDVVVAATPAVESARLLKHLNAAASELLEAIPYTTSILVHLAYPRCEFSHPLDGYGFLIPRKESGLIDACTWVSSKFDQRCPENRVLLRCVLHDGRGKAMDSFSSGLQEGVHRELARILNISCPPVLSRTTTIRQALPHLRPGHRRLMEELNSALTETAGLFLSGAYFRGPGMANCIEQAETVANEVVAFLACRSSRSISGPAPILAGPSIRPFTDPETREDPDATV